MRAASVLVALVVGASAASAQSYPPEGQPLPSPELVLRTFGFIMLDPTPVTDPGQPVTVDFLCARLVGASDQCEAGRLRLQETLNNSGQGHITVRNLQTMQSSYTSNGDMNTDISRVYYPSDGFADDIMAEREKVGADCVIVLTTAGNYCGLGYLVAGATSCIAVVSHGCIGNSSYEHEIGHNAGLSHDPPNSPDGGFGGYGYGYCGVYPTTGLPCGHKDVMTYPSPCGGSRTARYSNPLQACPLHPTVPFGTATSDGARVWYQRAPTMAAWRTSKVTTNRRPTRPERSRVVPR